MVALCEVIVDEGAKKAQGIWVVPSAEDVVIRLLLVNEGGSRSCGAVDAPGAEAVAAAMEAAQDAASAELEALSRRVEQAAGAGRRVKRALECSASALPAQRVRELVRAQLGWLSLEPAREDDGGTWRARVDASQFAEEPELCSQLQAWSRESGQPAAVVFELEFKPGFPGVPLFLRVVRPRFKPLTGHITQGGAICHPMLTPAGWRPTLSLESVLVGVCYAMVEGGARLQPGGGGAGDYGAREAHAAYQRMLAAHGWG